MGGKKNNEERGGRERKKMITQAHKVEKQNTIHYNLVQEIAQKCQGTVQREIQLLQG